MVMSCSRATSLTGLPLTHARLRSNPSNSAGNSWCIIIYSFLSRVVVLNHVLSVVNYDSYKISRHHKRSAVRNITHSSKIPFSIHSLTTSIRSHCCRKFPINRSLAFLSSSTWAAATSFTAFSNIGLHSSAKALKRLIHERNRRCISR